MRPDFARAAHKRLAEASARKSRPFRLPPCPPLILIFARTFGPQIRWTGTANEAIRTLKREIATLEGEMARLKASARPEVSFDPKALAREGARALWNLKEVLDDGTIEERRKVVEYFVDGVKVNGAEGWVEATFFERPKLPVSFCMAPPTGFEPVFEP